MNAEHMQGIPDKTECNDCLNGQYVKYKFQYKSQYGTNN